VAEGRRYLGLDVLARSRMSLLDGETTKDVTDPMTPEAISASAAGLGYVSCFWKETLSQYTAIRSMWSASTWKKDPCGSA
jgi:hypothetical protein